MNTDWRSRNTMKARDAAKAAAVILGLLAAAVLAAWATSRMLRGSGDTAPGKNQPACEQCAP